MGCPPIECNGEIVIAVLCVLTNWLVMPLVQYLRLFATIRFYWLLAALDTIGTTVTGHDSVAPSTLVTGTCQQSHYKPKYGVISVSVIRHHHLIRRSCCCRCRHSLLQFVCLFASFVMQIIGFDLVGKFEWWRCLLVGWCLPLCTCLPHKKMSNERWFLFILCDNPFLSSWFDCNFHVCRHNPICDSKALWNLR